MRPFPGSNPRQRPGAGEARRAHRGRPRGPFGRLEREGLGEVVDRLVHRLGPVAPALEPLEVDERVQAAVRRHEEFPLLARAPLGDDAAHAVALDARVLDVAVRLVDVLDEAALDLEAAGLEFLGGEPLAVGEIAHDLARFVRAEGDVVERHHAAHRRLPPLRRLPLVGDPRHPPLVVALVTALAAADDDLVLDRIARVVVPGRRLDRSGARGERARRHARDRGRRAGGDDGRGADRQTGCRQRALSGRSVIHPSSVWNRVHCAPRPARAPVATAVLPPKTPRARRGRTST